MKPNEITHTIIGAAIAVHRELGPGKPEAAYEASLAIELAFRGLAHHAQKPVPVIYKGVKLECGYRLDLLVADDIVVEVEAVEIIHPLHRAQVLTYLRLGGWKVSLLLNFNVEVMKEGVERMVLGFEDGGTETASAPRTRKHVSATLGEAVGFRRDVDSGDAGAESLAREAVAAAYEVHRELGPGLLPSAYEACLCHELSLRGLPFQRKRSLPLSYRGQRLSATDEIELLVDKKVVLRPLAVMELQPVHQAQLLSQLRLGGWNLGLSVNFNTTDLGNGIRRAVLTEGLGRPW